MLRVVGLLGSRTGSRSDGRSLRSTKERSEMSEEIRFFHSEIVIEKEEELSFHQVDFGGGEESGVTSPVFVLWGRVVEVFRGGDQDGEEHSVSSAVHSLCDFWETSLESVQVDKSAHKSWNLNV